MRIGTRGSALALAQAGRVATAARRERGASVRARADHDRGDDAAGCARRQVALRQGDRGGAARAARSTSPCTARRTCPAELPAGLAIAAVPRGRGPARRAGRAPARSTSCRRARGSERRACGGARSCSPIRPDLEVSALRGNVDTGCASSPRASTTRSCWRWPGCAGSAARRGRRALDRGRRLRARARAGILALEARAGDERRGSSSRRSSTSRPVARLDAERAVVEALEASCHTPVGAYAARRRRGDSGSIAYVGLPDGGEWIRDRRRGRRRRPRGRRRGARASGC